MLFMASCDNMLESAESLRIFSSAPDNEYRMGLAAAKC